MPQIYLLLVPYVYLEEIPAVAQSTLFPITSYLQVNTRRDLQGSKAFEVPRIFLCWRGTPCHTSQLWCTFNGSTIDKTVAK